MAEHNPSPATQELAESLRRVTGSLVRLVRAQADSPSTAQSETLGLLDRDGPLSITALAGRRGVKHQSMRLVVAQMESAGLLRRKANPDDGRSFLFALTAAGSRAVAAGRLARADWMADALEQRLSAAERQAVARAVKALEKLVSADLP